MKLKKLAGFALAAIAVFSLAACGSSNKKESTSQLDKIKKAGVLKVATSADFPPFEFQTKVDGKNKIVGSDIDMMNAVGKELGVKVEFENMSFDSVLAYVQAGKADVAVSGISATAKREKTFAFTTNYYNPPQVVVVQKQNVDKLTKTADFKGKNMAAQKGSLQETLVTEKMPDASMVSLKQVPDMISELNQGTVDGVLLEKTIAQSYIAKNPNLALSKIEFETDESNGYAVALQKDSTDLQKELNTIIKKLIKEGKIDGYVEKNSTLANSSAE